MKFLVVNLFLLIFLFNILGLNIIHGLKIQNDIENIKKLINCKVCQFSFNFNFNYDKLLEDVTSINNMKKFFVNTIDNEELEALFKKENIENISKEVSMQYFFKGSENQFIGQKFIDYTDCKENKKEKSFCDQVKLKLCDDILGMDNFCPNIKQLLIKNNSNNNADVSEIQKLQTNQLFKQKNKSFLQSNMVTNTVPQNANLMDILSNLKQLNFKQISPNKPTAPSNSLINNFMKKNKFNPNFMKNNDLANNNINFLQLTPEYINRNLSSKPRTHWAPPKPVLLQNFQKSITDQLKDIGFLTT